MSPESIEAREPAIAVVITTCDRPDFLKEAIRSVLSQELLPAELVVVDDSSGGSAQAVAAGFDYPFQFSYLRSPGRGANHARNLGWRSTRSPLLAFLDDDDEFMPSKLAEQSRLLLERKLDIVSCGQLRCVMSGSQLVSREVYIPRYAPAAAQRAVIRTYNTVTTSSILCRRSLLEAIGGFDEALPQFQDWDLVLRAMSRARLDFVRKPLIRYNIHDRPSIGKSNTLKNLRTFYEKHSGLYGSLPARALVFLYYAYKRRWAWLSAFRDGTSDGRERTAE